MTLMLSTSSRTAAGSDSAVRRWRVAARGRSTLGAVVAMGIIGLTTGCTSQSSSQSLSQAESQSQSQSSLPVQTPVPVPALSPISVQSPTSIQSPNPIQSPNLIQSPSPIQSLTQGLSPSLSPSANAPIRPIAPNGLALAVRTNQDAVPSVSLAEPSSAVNLPSAVAAQNTPTAPGPLPALGLAAAFGYSNRLRKRIKQSGNSYRSLK
jgi:hypothetical protein